MSDARAIGCLNDSWLSFSFGVLKPLSASGASFWLVYSWTPLISALWTRDLCTHHHPRLLHDVVMLISFKKLLLQRDVEDGM